VKHRHLNHEGFSLAAIDDIISRGGRGDWIELREATADPAIARKILQVCRARTDDPYAQRYHLWRHYVSRNVA